MAAHGPEFQAFHGLEELVVVTGGGGGGFELEEELEDLLELFELPELLLELLPWSLALL